MLRKFSDLNAFRRDPLALLTERGRAGGPLVRLHLGLKPVFLVADPALARELLRADEADLGKGRHVAKLARMIGLNSLTMSGEAHGVRRTLVHRALSRALSDAGASGISAAVRAWIAELARADEVEAHVATAHLALRLVCAMLFGAGALTQGDEAVLIEAVRLVEDDIAADMFRVMPKSPWAALRQARRLRKARAMMDTVVARTAGRAEAGGLVADLKAGGLHGAALRDEILFLLLAGHHTTGAAAAWTLYFQAADPLLARSLVQEGERTCGRDGEFTPAALRGASLSRALAFEALRLYPSSYWMSRDLARRREVASVPLARGTTLIVAPWHLHRDPRHWDEPDRLQLDRNWVANPAYMPFGVGGRACTGMAMAQYMLQLIALEFAATFDSGLVSALPPGPPVASVTLAPPPIRLHIAVRGTKARVSEVAA